MVPATAYPSRALTAEWLIFDYLVYEEYAKPTASTKHSVLQPLNDVKHFSCALLTPCEVEWRLAA